MQPVGSPMTTLMACSQAAFDPAQTDQFETMLLNDISFKMESPGQVTLSGSGLVLQLEAAP
jgi:hypothetical protein